MIYERELDPEKPVESGRAAINFSILNIYVRCYISHYETVKENIVKIPACQRLFKATL